MEPLDELLACLAGLALGPLTAPSATKVVEHLIGAWDLFLGSAEGGMQAYKLHGRVESVEWRAPTLSFQIERHGGVVQGSIRAELQSWAIDLDRRTATLVQVRPRQISAAGVGLDVGAIAREIASAVVEGRDDERIERLGDGVKILIAQAIPATNKQTTADRRRRFREALESLLSEHGWRRRPAGSQLVFERAIADV